MPLYAYIATDRSGKKVQGYIDAASKSVAYQKVKARGLFPTKLDQDVSRASKAVAGESLAYSLLQLSALLRAGIPLDEALDSIAEFDEDPAMRSAMKRVRVRLRRRRAQAQEERRAFLGRRGRPLLPGLVIITSGRRPPGPPRRRQFRAQLFRRGPAHFLGRPRLFFGSPRRGRPLAPFLIMLHN